MDSSGYLRSGRHLSRHSQTLRLLTTHRQKTTSTTAAAENPLTPHLRSPRPEHHRPVHLRDHRVNCCLTMITSTHRVIVDPIYRQR